jgi:hypothetical protein
MWWNYIRFGSILEFGANYQLTAIDMTNLTYISPVKIIKAIIQYLFTMPIVKADQFPFLFIKQYPFYNLDFNVLMYEFNCFGILVVPIVWIFTIYNLLKKKLKLDKELTNTIFMFLMSMFLILIIDARNGVDHVYIIDIKIFLYLFAIILYFKLLEKHENILIQKVFWIICAFSIILTLPINLSFGQEYLNYIDTNIKVILKNIFEFWT